MDQPISHGADDLTERNGGCHCGEVRFKALLPTELKGGRCNCSMCRMKGAVMVGTRIDRLEVTHGQDLLSCYQFNTMEAKHWFCSRCGIHCFHQRRSYPDQYAINAACLEGVSPFDFAEVPVIDGLHHPNDHGGEWRTAGVVRFEPAPE